MKKEKVHEEQGFFYSHRLGFFFLAEEGTRGLLRMVHQKLQVWPPPTTASGHKGGT